MRSSELNAAGNAIGSDLTIAVPRPDPLTYLEQLLVKLNTWYLRVCYPFADCGAGVSIHYSCEIPRQMALGIWIGKSVFLGKGVWLNVVDFATRSTPAILLGDGCAIGRNSVISAKNRVCIESGVLLAPAVLIMDHNHEFSDISRSIKEQGTTPGGTVTIGKNSWLGYGAAVVCGKGDLTIGRNCVVAANAVVTKSVPPYSVVGGNPAKVIRRFDQASDSWIRVGE